MGKNLGYACMAYLTDFIHQKSSANRMEIVYLEINHKKCVEIAYNALSLSLLFPESGSSENFTNKK